MAAVLNATGGLATNVCVCVCILNWPLPIGAFQDQYKQTMINKYSNEHNHVKNPNWQEANQLAIYKRSREVELGATENNISQWSERDLNPRHTDFKSGAPTTRPRCLQQLLLRAI